MLYISIYYCDSTTILTNSVVEFVLFSVEYSMRCFSPQQAPPRPAVFLKKYGVYDTMFSQTSKSLISLTPWGYYTTDPTVSGGSMNPSARQRRHHDRWVHYTTLSKDFHLQDIVYLVDRGLLPQSRKWISKSARLYGFYLFQRATAPAASVSAGLPN